MAFLPLKVQNPPQRGALNFQALAWSKEAAHQEAGRHHRQRGAASLRRMWRAPFCWCPKTKRGQALRLVSPLSRSLDELPFQFPTTNGFFGEKTEDSRFFVCWWVGGGPCFPQNQGQPRTRRFSRAPVKMHVFQPLMALRFPFFWFPSATFFGYA